MLIDDFHFREYFNPPSCPYIKSLEEFYEILGCHWISKKILEKSSPNTPISVNDISELVKNNIVEKAKLIINNMYKSFSTGDIPAVLEALDPKVVWNEAEGKRAESVNGTHIAPSLSTSSSSSEVTSSPHFVSVDVLTLAR